MKQEELLAKVRKEEEESDRKNISLIVVGEHVSSYVDERILICRPRGCWQIDLDGPPALRSWRAVREGEDGE